MMNGGQNTFVGAAPKRRFAAFHAVLCNAKMKTVTYCAAGFIHVAQKSLWHPILETPSSDEPTFSKQFGCQNSWAFRYITKRYVDGVRSVRVREIGESYSSADKPDGVTPETDAMICWREYCVLAEKLQLCNLQPHFNMNTSTSTFFKVTATHMGSEDTNLDISSDIALPRGAAYVWNFTGVGEITQGVLNK